MVDEVRTPAATAAVHVNASAQQVWSLISDLSRMGEWSPETQRVEWTTSAHGPVVGAKFKGYNGIGSKRWSTQGTIVEAEPERALSWDVTAGPVGLRVARWSYRLTPTDDGGCDVAEEMYDHRGRLIAWIGGVVTGVKDRASHNRAGMQATLEALKSAAEQS